MNPCKYEKISPLNYYAAVFLRKNAALNNKSIEELLSFLLTATDREFEAFFKGTEAATFAYKTNEKTTHSIRSVLFLREL